ncbi:hypothetical protein ACFYPN_23685 [Streptomyces sp. NPDC005576]|uniref:hypothetical protein n=1 Tax=unclassified Streptomyces TaxID=2593676 RepID=UPI0033D5E42E
MTSAWPHEPAVVDFHASEGRSWRLWFSADGTRTTRLPGPGTISATTADRGPEAADSSVRGTVDELVLSPHDRTPISSLEQEGDQPLFGGSAPGIPTSRT